MEEDKYDEEGKSKTNVVVEKGGPFVLMAPRETAIPALSFDGRFFRWETLGGSRYPTCGIHLSLRLLPRGSSLVS